MQNNFVGVIPELSVRDVAETLQYYQDVLGYRIEGQHEDIFGSVLRGKANLYFRKSEEEVHPSCCYIWVEKVDELCRAFQAQGVMIVGKREDKPWGYRQFTLEDINGHYFHYFRFTDQVE